MASAPRHPLIIRLRTGIKRDGRLWARDARVIYNGGAYGAFKPSPPAHMSGGLTMGGAYRVPQRDLESMCVYTNQVPGGYMRASGELQTVFSVESHMDMIASEIAMDPLEFRLLNALVEGDSNYSRSSNTAISNATKWRCARAKSIDNPSWRRENRET